mmetsp:Transcript_28358/g.65785  ORF Transcript_28358/g.65785 Transcript_28358/m.65785 type:complete len:320 (-) Transcript_28358:152-1111(-)
MNSQSNSEAEIMSIIEAMRSQEESYICKHDYLSDNANHCDSETNLLVRLCHGMMGTSNKDNDDDDDVIDEESRHVMANWCFTLVDYLSFHRETVSIAMSYLDRFMSTTQGKAVRKQVFPLVVMTCLYTAIKLHEPEAIAPGTIAELSRGQFTEAEVVAVEAILLQSIGWKMNPPTALEFCHKFLAIMTNVPHERKHAILELAQFQTEVAVLDYHLVGVNASTVAFAALANAFRELHYDNDDDSMLDHIFFMAEIQDDDGMMLLEVQERLWNSVCATCLSQRTSWNHAIGSNNNGCNVAMADGKTESSHYSPRTVVSQQQ